MVARLTKNLVCSTLQRLIKQSGKERYSRPLLFGPDYDTLIRPMASCVDEADPPQFPAIGAGAYILSRFDETYSYRQNED